MLYIIYMWLGVSESICHVRGHQVKIVKHKIVCQRITNIAFLPDASLHDWAYINGTAVSQLSKRFIEVSREWELADLCGIKIWPVI